MESFEDFTVRLTTTNRRFRHATVSELRKYYNQKYGVWPSVQGGSGQNETAFPKSQSAPHVRLVNTHQTLDRVATFISLVGWLVVCLGSVTALVVLGNGLAAFLIILAGASIRTRFCENYFWGIWIFAKPRLIYFLHFVRAEEGSGEESARASSDFFGELFSARSIKKW